jgi:hypothetical protein
MQQVQTRFCPSSEETGYLEIKVTLTRESGESNAWRRINKGFLHAFRKQLLLWRSLDDEEKKHYEQLLDQFSDKKVLMVEMPEEDFVKCEFPGKCDVKR